MYLISQIKYKQILSFLSSALLIISAVLIVTGITGFIYSEDVFMYYFYYATVLLGISALIKIFFNPKNKKTINIRDSFVIILLLWFIVPVIGMFPFLFASPINNITDALFESFAGFTTTGFTSLTEFDNVPRSIVLYRSLIQWIGGMGILLAIIAIFPFIYTGNIKAFFSDLNDVEFSPLHQRVGKTAKILWIVYIVYSIIGIIALYLVGKDFFDSVIYSFAAISTGGGVPVNGNLTEQTYAVKTILMALMFIAGANYFFLFKSLRKFSFIKSEEINFYMGILFVSFILIAIVGSSSIGYSNTLLFESFFNVVSFVSTTGFYSAEVFSSNILFIWILLFFLMFIGSSTGSSGGGINVYRIIVLFKMLRNYIRSSIHSNYLTSIKLDNRQVNTKMVQGIIGFFVLYILIFLFGAILLTFFGYEIENAFSLCAASMSNSGPAVFLLDSEFAISDINLGAKYTVIILMVIGRVELIPILIFFSKSFWSR